MSDLDLAAAFAAGEAPPQAAFAPPGARRPPPPARRNGAQRIDAEMGGEPEGELPSIDDLEVAAAAAGVAPTPPMLTELGYELGPPPQAEPMQQDSSSDEEEGGSSGDEGAQGRECRQRVSALLQLCALPKLPWKGSECHTPPALQLMLRSPAFNSQTGWALQRRPSPPPAASCA